MAPFTKSHHLKRIREALHRNSYSRSVWSRYPGPRTFLLPQPPCHSSFNNTELYCFDVTHQIFAIAYLVLLFLFLLAAGGFEWNLISSILSGLLCQGYPSDDRWGGSGGQKGDETLFSTMHIRFITLYLKCFIVITEKYYRLIGVAIK